MKDSSNKEILLQFKGQLEFDSISDLIYLLKEKMKERHVNYVTYKKILMLMIESLENILRYNKHIDLKSRVIVNTPPEFTIFTENNQYIIESSNVVLNQDITGLKERFEQINRLSKNKIKDLYKSTITNGKFSDKGGAGLGIIEMAKISDEKLIFSFSAIDELHSIFTLCLFLSPGIKKAVRENE
jgi:hypothetical protein